MTTRAGRKLTWGQTRWFNIFIFNFNAILFFPLTLWNSFAVKSNTGPKREVNWLKAFHALSEWQEFHSWITSRRPFAASVAIAYILWFLEMHPQGPSCLFAAGRHWLLVSLDRAPDRFFIFTTGIWLYLLGMLKPEQRLDLCFGMGASGGSHSLKSIQHYPIILILASQWWKQQMPVGIMGHFMAQTVHLNTVHVRLQTRTSLKLFMYHSTSQVCSLLYWARD